MKNRIPKNHWLLTRPIAHRGLHNSIYPENSLSAVYNAKTNNYPIETDLRLLADGAVAVVHDENLTRLTREDARVSEQTAQSIKSFRLMGTNERILLLDELLEAVGGAVPLLIEIKDVPRLEALCRATIDVLKGYGGEYAVQSFHPQALHYFKKHAPHVLRGQLSQSLFPGLPLVKSLPLARLAGYRFYNRLDFVSYNIDDLPNRYAEGKNLICFTVDTPEKLAKARELGINVIFESVKV